MMKRDKLMEALDRDLAGMLKGKPLTDPAPYFCQPSDMEKAEYYRLRMQMAEAAAVRSLKAAEVYRQEAAATRRAAERAVEQASEREQKLRRQLVAVASEAREQVLAILRREAQDFADPHTKALGEFILRCVEAALEQSAQGARDG